MTLIAIYILAGVGMSIGTLIKVGVIPALCILGATFIAPIGAGGAREGFRGPVTNTGTATIAFGCVLIVVACWLGSFFAIPFYDDSEGGVLWAIVGAVLGFLFAARTARMATQRDEGFKMTSKTGAILKELFVGAIGWLWIAAVIFTIYQLVMVALFHGSWPVLLGSAAATWLLYRVSLHFQLEKERMMRVAAGKPSGS